MADSDVPERILIVTAHPDDVDFGAAGSIASWTKAGAEVTYCIVTNGDAGALERETDLGTLEEVRQAEQRAAAAEVGVSDVRFLGYPDGKLEVSLALRRDISRVIRSVRPQRVVTQSPERNWDRIRASHPDHMAAGEATLQAVYPDARNPFAHPELLEEGLEPHVVDQVWLMASPRARFAIDITDTLDRKIAALLSHRSQVGEGDHIAEMIRHWGEHTAEEQGLPAGRIAEAFQIVQTA
ncbi:MAG TPA: PIG-L deacetylase family protein [Acidimicrobiales bacterium]|nr:PIG-L deacetylase family protein [Acidimicrobiales bacterium]